jgi:hypothetical protein
MAWFYEYRIKGLSVAGPQSHVKLHQIEQSVALDLMWDFQHSEWRSAASLFGDG